MTEPISDEDLQTLAVSCLGGLSEVSQELLAARQEIERLRGALQNVANATPTMTDLRDAQMAVRDLLY